VNLTGYTKEEVIGKTPRILQGEKTDALQLKIIKEAILKYQPCEMEILNYKKDGSEFWSSVFISPIKNTDGQYTHWMGIKRDATDKKKQDIIINRAMILAQEKEKYIIGSELHDNALQTLVSSLLSLGMIKNVSSENDLFHLNESRKSIQTSIKTIRDLSQLLAPAGFEENSLEHSFEKLLKSINVENRFLIHLNFDITTTYIIPPELKLNLYRILQEQLNNILKYSEAKRIDISVTIEDNKIRMRIYDNGVGFNFKLLKKDGIGLNNIKKRTEMFSGALTINTSPGNGCELLVDIPIINEKPQVIDNEIL
jgi:PAS domain S-box-containing protein